MATGDLDQAAKPASGIGSAALRQLRASQLAALGLTGGLVAVSALVVDLITPHGRNLLVDNLLGVLVLVIVAAVFLREIAAPLLLHFDYGRGSADTHGTAHFASQADIDALTKTREGLLIGREGPTANSCVMTAPPIC